MGKMTLDVHSKYRHQDKRLYHSNEFLKWFHSGTTLASKSHAGIQSPPVVLEQGHKNDLNTSYDPRGLIPLQDSIAFDAAMSGHDMSRHNDSLSWGCAKSILQEEEPPMMPSAGLHLSAYQTSLSHAFFKGFST